MAKAKTDTATDTEKSTAAAKPKAPSAAKQNAAVKALLSISGNVFDTVSQSVENLTSKKALEVLPQLLDSVDNTFFAIGGIMARIHEESWWKDAGFESFKEYVEEECGQSYRTTMYWVQIYNDLIKAGVPFEAVDDIGWSKLKEISTVLTPENYEEWLTRAREMSLKQLIEYVKAMKSGGSESGAEEGVNTNTSDVKNVTFKLHDDQKAIVDASLQSAMEQIGTEYPAVAIEHICNSFLQGEGGAGVSAQNLGDTFKEIGFQKVLEEFEKQFPNVDLEVTVN